MGSVVKTIAGVALIAIGIFVPGAQFLIGPGIGLTLSGIQGMLSPKPKTNQATGQRLNKNLEPEAFRKIVFGKTAGGADLRYWEVWGSDEMSYDEVVAVAGHKINSFQNFYLEEKLIAFSGSNSSGNATTAPYTGLLIKNNNDGTVGNAALTVGAGIKWTSASKFRGSAHYALRWTYDQDKLPQGIPSRYTCEVEGALLYDPRKDSTRGGSGTHRADDQTTWAYSTLDSNGVPIGRNNALQVLWYLIGWRIADTSGNQVLVCGRGVDLQDIDFAAFIAAANDAEAQSYYTDCILSTGDPHSTNESVLTADGGLGTLIDPGGFWTYKVNKDDTGVIDVSLGDGDVVDTGPVEWKPSKPLSEQFNRVVGGFVDPSVLYQSSPYPQVIDTAYETADGFKKRKTLNYQAIQDPLLAQKISGIVLNQTRWQGEFTAKFNYNALKTQLYGNVSLTLSQYGFSSKLFKVLEMTIEADGVTMRLAETDTSVWTARATTTPGAPGTGANGGSSGVNLAGVVLTNVSVQTLSGLSPGIHVVWTAPGNPVQSIYVAYRKVGDTNWTASPILPRGETGVDIFGLAPNTQYEVRTKTYSVLRVFSAWQSAGNITTGNFVPADEVLRADEKKDSLAKLYADLEARYTDLFNRATALSLSTTAITTARSDWRNLVQSFSPAWNDATQDTTILTSVYGDRLFPTGWTQNGVGSIAANGAYTTLTDSDAASSANWQRTFTIPSGPAAVQYSGGIVVKKDAIPASTRTVRINLRGTGGTQKDVTLDFDSSTGASATTGTFDAQGVYDLGDEWLVWGTYTTDPTNTATRIIVQPARATSLAGGTSNALTGSVDIRGAPILVQGDWKKLGRAMLQAKLVAYSGAMTTLIKAVSQVDGITSVVIDPPANVLISADSTGVIKTGELPRDVPIKASAGTSDVTALGTWTRTSVSGITCTMGSATGVLNITAMTVQDIMVPVTYVYGIITRTLYVHVVRVDDPPSVAGGGGSGGGGSTSSTTTLGATTGTAYDLTNSVSATLTCAAGAGGNVVLNAPVSFRRSGTAAGFTGAIGKWQWRVVAGSFADVTTEVGDSADAETDVDPVDGSVTKLQGSITCNPTKSGLTAGTNYEFRFCWRRVDVSGTAANVSRMSGTLTATGT